MLAARNASTRRRSEGAARSPEGEPAIIGGDTPASPDEVARIEDTLRAEILARGLGMGMGINHTPGATRSEVIERFRLAAERTYRATGKPSVGVGFLLVAGTPVIDGGHVVEGVAPGLGLTGDRLALP